MYFAVFSYSLCTYFITSIWYNIKIHLLQNYTYLLGYLIVTGTISFGISYRMGPVENPRSLNLIQWSLQFLALVLIFCSSYHQAASLTIVLSMLLWEVIPSKWKNFAYWNGTNNTIACFIWTGTLCHIAIWIIFLI